MIRGLWALAGLVLGVLGALAHRHDVHAVGLDLPWGIVVAVAPLVPVALVADRAVSAGSAAVLIGWGLMVALQGSISPGDYLVANDLVSWAFLGLGLGCLGGVVLGNSKLRR
ncbi:MAG: hypothetical protein QM621_10835 [Aeromicrobium sp.]|uniref:hypothetical protein n=1 Tax=Aeromicrobium sp. TaxID=1871063 RepID=UPI0039E65D0F